MRARAHVPVTLWLAALVALLCCGAAPSGTVSHGDTQVQAERGAQTDSSQHGTPTLLTPRYQLVPVVSQPPGQLPGGQSSVAVVHNLEMNSHDWRFVGGGAWSDKDSSHLGADTPPGTLVPPPFSASTMTRWIDNVAFYTASTFADATIRTSFRWGAIPYTTAGIVLKAVDAQTFYLVEFPTVGQAYRAEQFWVVISRVRPETGGWHEAVHMERVPGVSSTPALYHAVPTPANLHCPSRSVVCVCVCVCVCV